MSKKKSVEEVAKEYIIWAYGDQLQNRFKHKSFYRQVEELSKIMHERVMEETKELVEALKAIANYSYPEGLYDPCISMAKSALASFKERNGE